jgi:hypothetical protein
MGKQATAADVLNAWAVGVEQCAEAAGIEIVFIHPPLFAFAFKRQLSKDAHFCCPNENRAEVEKLWEERNAGSGSLV